MGDNCITGPWCAVGGVSFPNTAPKFKLAISVLLFLHVFIHINYNFT